MLRDIELCLTGVDALLHFVPDFCHVTPCLCEAGCLLYVPVIFCGF